MTVLSDAQKREVIGLFRRKGTTIDAVRARYDISQATCYRLRAEARDGVDPSQITFRRPGSQSTISPEQRINLTKAIRRAVAEFEQSWQDELAKFKAHPKSAEPILGIADVRKIAEQLGIDCSDSTLRRLLKEMLVLTAGQRRHRRQERLRKKRHM